jgi:predicted PurR-regulated permease PerM
MLSGTTRNAIMLIAVVVTGAALWWLRGILTPLVMAMFLMILIDGLARVLEQRIPPVTRRAAMPLALIIAFTLFAATVFFIAENTRAFVGQLIQEVPQLHARLFAVAGRFGLEIPPTVDEFVGQLNLQRLIAPVASSLENIGSSAVFVLIYLGFLLAARTGFERKIVRLFPSHDRREAAVRIFSHIGTAVERYVWVQTVTGAAMALAAWALMAAVGLNNAVFWAFFIFVAAYIPMIGAAVSIFAPALFALIQFPTVTQALVLLVGIEVIFFFVGNVVLPKLQGDSLNQDPVVVLLALAFWSAIWGLPGAFLSSPLTVALMVVLAQFPGSRWIAILLSADGLPDTGASGDVSHPPRRPRRAPAKAGDKTSAATEA